MNFLSTVFMETSPMARLSQAQLEMGGPVNWKDGQKSKAINPACRNGSMDGPPILLTQKCDGTSETTFFDR